MSDTISRRELLKVAGAAGAGVLVSEGSAGAQGLPAAGPVAGEAAVPVQAATGQVAAGQEVLFFFNDVEARLVDAMIGRLIPADEWPGASEAGVLYAIDRQLAAAYGAGDKMYLKGPWKPDAPPQQGYQLRFTPAELYRTALTEIREAVARDNDGTEFWDLPVGAMDQILKSMETGEMTLPSLPSAVFFETLLANTIEGYFADPAYGGNRDMAAWRMIGFPGAYAQYLDWVDRYGVPYPRQPISFANTAARIEHIAGHGHQ